MNRKPHSEATKEKIRQKLLGHEGWTKGMKRGTPHNKLPTKTVFCECCNMPFEVRVTSKQKYYKGHYQKLIKSGGNPCSKQEIKDKIRNTIIETYKKHPEILENRKPSGINQFSEGYTSIEKLIADALNSMNIAFYHNIKVGRYFPDFLIFHNVIIECDGEYWHNEEKDSKRDSYLMNNGYYIFRLAGKRILKDPIGCVKGIVTILHHIDHRHALTYELKN